MNRAIYLLVLIMLAGRLPAMAQGLVDLSDIRVRDPFILVDKESKTYYLYAQMQNRLNSTLGEVGVEVYQSKDLKKWSGPTPVFEAPEDFWGRKSVWAPEVHEYRGDYYLFVTFTSYDTLDYPGRSTAPQWKRGTQVLRSKSPLGPFKTISKGTQTPPEWMSLDGSLWVEDEQPYMVFCHEWAQIKEGTIDLVKLSGDLSEAISTPIQLFGTTDIPWAVSLRERGSKHHGYVTDGNFVFKTKTGKLVMIWSTFGPAGYALIQAVSENGSIYGPWKHIKEPLFTENGGHGMIFKTLQGKLMLTLHQPNGGKLERARLFEIEDLGDRIRLAR